MVSRLDYEAYREMTEERRATATARAVEAGDAPKGEVLAVARLADAESCELV